MYSSKEIVIDKLYIFMGYKMVCVYSVEGLDQAN
jgi:hypothetical protein